jgi:hypothetical protein
VDNIYYPACARGVKFTVARGYIGGPAAFGHITWTVRIVDATTGNTISHVASGDKAIHLPLGAGTVMFDIELPMFFNYALVGTRRIEIDFDTNWSAGTPGVVVEIANVNAWKMTP